MAIQLKQSLKLSQNLVMTPQLQQAIKLLQLSRMELQEQINQELVDNPLLEEVMEEGRPDNPDSPDRSQELDRLERNEAEGPKATEIQPEGNDKIVEGKQEFDWEEYVENFTSNPPVPSTREVPDELPNYENLVTKETDLKGHLEWQISMSSLVEHEQELAKHIIGNLKDDGYFNGSLEDIARELKFDIEDAEEVLKVVQRFDPLGVAARSLQECLLIQIEVLSGDNTLMIDIVSNHLNHLENRNYQAIAKATGHSIDTIVSVTKEMMELNPKPGREYATISDTQYITPDVYVYKVGDDFEIVLNEEGLPKLRVSSYYKRVLNEARAEAAEMGGDTKQYVQDKLRAAVWLIKSIHNRQKTIYRVMESILKYQREFFTKGVHYLKPLVLREVANDIGVHESTISRVTSNKYAHTPVGIFELKYFFNSGISTGTSSGDIASESVKQRIKELVAKEDSKRPLSDQKLVEILKDGGINIARRTVAKYRESLGILSSSRRKKLF